MFLTSIHRTRKIARSGGVAFCRDGSQRKSSEILTDFELAGIPLSLSPP
ncbi:MAG: hypothetical protein QOE34_202 [Verrucomicrobiota bacterium]